jgi:hypothetical protein
MQTYLSFSIINALGFELGQYGFYGRVFGRNLHLCVEKRLAGERWAWLDRGETCTTGRLGCITFTTAKRLAQ